MVLDAAERLNLWIAVGVVAGSAVLAPPLFTLSVGIGAAMEVVNFRVFRRGTEAFFASAIEGRGPGAGGFALRFGLLAIALTAAVAAGAHPVGLVLGLSTIVPAVVIAAIRHPMRPPPGTPEDAGPAPGDPDADDWNPWLARERRRDDDEDDDDAGPGARAEPTDDARTGRDDR